MNEINIQTKFKVGDEVFFTVIDEEAKSYIITKMPIRIINIEFLGYRNDNDKRKYIYYGFSTDDCTTENHALIERYKYRGFLYKSEFHVFSSEEELKNSEIDPLKDSGYQLMLSNIFIPQLFFTDRKWDQILYRLGYQ